MMGPLLQVENACVRLAQRRVLHDVSLKLVAGRRIALLGPNGAGKSTLLRAIAGLLPATGSFSFAGEELASLGRGARARLIGYLPQSADIHWPLQARDVVALGRHPHGARDPAHLSASDGALVDAAMARVGVGTFAHRPVTDLSGGERARVLLARLLAGVHDILLADEPVAALDPAQQLIALEAFRTEAARGALCLLVMHDVALACRHMDDLIVLSDGRVIAHGPVAEIVAGDALDRAYGLRFRRIADPPHTHLVAEQLHEQ
jgi:iron complex transport system ATP-binding protein